MTVSGPDPSFRPQSERDRLPPGLARFVSPTLRIGVGLSATLALIGLGLLLAHPTTAFTMAAVVSTPFSASAFFSGLAHGQAVDILFLAFLVLIATPLTRVVISVTLFAKAGDRAFTALTLSVLALLVASVVIGAII